MFVREKMLRRIFGPKKKDERGRRRKLQSEEHLYLYSLPSVITVIKSMRMR
jgi:hypothetical protein